MIRIRINDTFLDEAQVDTLRVALSNFYTDLDGEHGQDIGKPLADAYQARIAEIEALMCNVTPTREPRNNYRSY